MQRHIIEATRDYLRNLPEAEKTAVLVNQIEQLCATVPPVSPSHFTSAVSRRRKQLTEISIPYMQSKFLGRFYKGLIGIPISIGVPALLSINEIISSTTALPVGLLGFVICLRYIAGAWEKSRRKLWADYNRVGIGLSEDLQHVVEDTLVKQLKVFPQTAIEGVTSQVVRRETLTQELIKEVEEIEMGLQTR